MQTATSLTAALREAGALVALAELATALSAEALGARLDDLPAQDLPAARQSAANLAALVADSALEAHAPAPAHLRAAPAALGAARAALDAARALVEGAEVPGGPLARLAATAAAQAIAELAALAARRMPALLERPPSTRLARAGRPALSLSPLRATAEALAREAALECAPDLSADGDACIRRVERCLELGRGVLAAELTAACRALRERLDDAGERQPGAGTDAALRLLESHLGDPAADAPSEQLARAAELAASGALQEAAALLCRGLWAPPGAEEAS